MPLLLHYNILLSLMLLLLLISTEIIRYYAHTRTASSQQQFLPGKRYCIIEKVKAGEMEFTALDLGAHCAFCNRHDFLPFKCDDCGLCFCLEHKDGLKHECSKVYVHDEGKKDSEESMNANLGSLSFENINIESDSYCSTSTDQNDLNSSAKNRSGECFKRCKSAKKKKKRKKNKCKFRGCKCQTAVFFPCKCCGKNYCIGHLQQEAHKCSSLNLAAQEARQKHQAMLMSKQARDLAKLLKCKS